MNINELNKILEEHYKWVRGKGGVKANLSGRELDDINLPNVNLYKADLSDVKLARSDLSGADLSGADLSGADLSGANLSHAKLSCANLSGADLSGANLSHVDLTYANLSVGNLSRSDLTLANLFGADLSYADLSEVNLSGANLSGADLSYAEIDKWKINYNTIGVHDAPEGDLIVWGKKNKILVKMLVPSEAKRSCATTRKHRAEYVKVLEVLGVEETVVKNEYGVTVYKPGKIVHCHEWDDNRWNECSGGIHFFLTKEEAENW